LGHLVIQNYDCTDKAIQPALWSVTGTSFTCVTQGFYLPYVSGTGVIKACLYDFRNNKPFTTPIEMTLGPVVLPTDLDAAISNCNGNSDAQNNNLNPYQTQEVDPAYNAFLELRDLGVTKGYVIVSGATYSFTETATDLYKTDLIAAEDKYISRLQIKSSIESLSGWYGADAAYFTNLKY